MRTALLATALILSPAAGAGAESGPKAGEKVPALKAFGVVGAVENKEADFAADRKDAPTVYLFVQAEEGGIPVGGRPLARFMKTLDKDMSSIDGAKAVAIWLGDKAFDKHKEYLPRINQSLQFENTSLAAFDGDKSGPNGWGINPDVHITVVVAAKGKVVKSFPLISVNETDVKPVVAELKKVAGK
jgi:hypothetical protein